VRQMPMPNGMVKYHYEYHFNCGQGRASGFAQARKRRVAAGRRRFP
jgi:hypothetical protein